MIWIMLIMIIDTVYLYKKILQRIRQRHSDLDQMMQKGIPEYSRWSHAQTLRT